MSGWGGGDRWWGRRCQLSFKDIIPLLWCWSQHWRNEYPAPQPDIHCKAQYLQTLSVMCYFKANIQLYFVNGYFECRKTGKDRGRCVCKCNQTKSIKTPNLVLFLVAVTFNTSWNGFIFRWLKAVTEWQKWQQKRKWYTVGFCRWMGKGELIVTWV